MKQLNFKMLPALILSVITSVFFSSCYDKFDPDSYRPSFSVGGFTSTKEIAPTNLVGYWAFNGNLVDSVSNTAGENVGTTFSNGIKGQALQGTLSSYVLFTPGTAITSMKSFTLAFWVNSPAPSTGIIGLVNLARTNGFWGNIETFFENGSTNTEGKFRTHLFNGTTDKEFATNNLVNAFDSWTHITISYDAATETYKLYSNGAPVTTTVATGFGPLNFTNVGKLVFGATQFQTIPSQTSESGQQSWASYLTGALDEVRIYNKALSDAEVNALVKLEGKGK